MEEIRVPTKQPCKRLNTQRVFMLIVEIYLLFFFITDSFLFPRIIQIPPLHASLIQHLKVFERNKAVSVIENKFQIKNEVALKLFENITAKQSIN